MTGHAHERGAALLTVLLLVAVMATVSALALERLTLAARLGGSAAAVEQARLYVLSAEAMATQRIAGLRDGDRTVLTGDWPQRAFTAPLPQGSATLRLRDGGNCFNLNSLVADAPTGGGLVRTSAVTQLTTLLTTIGIDPGLAARLAAASADAIDADNLVQPGGYEGSETPNRPLVQASEIARLPGMTPALWQQAAPWLCALPDSDPSPINVNSLLPEQAPLLVMLVGPSLPLAQARARIAARPAEGYASVLEFWNAGGTGAARPSSEAAAQVRIATRWFRLHSTVRVGDVTLAAETLVDADGATPRVIQRAWMESE